MAKKVPCLLHGQVFVMKMPTLDVAVLFIKTYVEKSIFVNVQQVFFHPFVYHKYIYSYRVDFAKNICKSIVYVMKWEIENLFYIILKIILYASFIKKSYNLCCLYVLIISHKEMVFVFCFGPILIILVFVLTTFLKVAKLQ